MSIELVDTGLNGLKVVRNRVFRDNRGYFTEVFNQQTWTAAGLPLDIVQANHSGSLYGVVRGLHFQWDPPMGKLMRVSVGKAFLVAVDIRFNSPTRGQWYGVEASAEDKVQLWGEAGFARGFCALSDFAEVQYLCTGTYNGKAEAGIRWNDPEIGIRWPVENPTLSGKDAEAQTLSEWLQRPEAKLIV